MTAFKAYEKTSVPDEMMALDDPTSAFNNNMTSITAMKEYSDFSFEQLKLKDYDSFRIAKLYAPIIAKPTHPDRQALNENEQTKCPTCYESIIEV